MKKNILITIICAIPVALTWGGAYFATTIDGPDEAQAQIRQTVPPGCGWISNGSSGNRDSHALVCNGGTLRGWVNVEGGRYVPGRPKQLNLNLSGGSARHRGYVVLSPDNGKGSILEGGRKDKLALFRSNRFGGTQFRIQPKFLKGLVVCDNTGKNCFDLYETITRLDKVLPKVDLPTPTP